MAPGGFLWHPDGGFLWHPVAFCGTRWLFVAPRWWLFVAPKDGLTFVGLAQVARVWPGAGHGLPGLGALESVAAPPLALAALAARGRAVQVQVFCVLAGRRGDGARLRGALAVEALARGRLRGRRHGLGRVGVGGDDGVGVHRRGLFLGCSI